MNYTAKELTENATRMDNDVNGNPRYYLPVFMFTDDDGNMIRPPYCNMYRGKKFAPGWVFQSYNLEYDLKLAIANM